MQRDSDAYLTKKQFFNTLLTVYGRKPVLEALQQPGIEVYRLHLAQSNKRGGIIDEILMAAEKRGAEIAYHDRAALARISKNAKQDQGVAVDLICQKFTTTNDFLAKHSKQNCNLLALDGITNPQNLGMIIRSACAGNIDGIILPEKGCAQIDPLVIKASAGTVFKAPILRTTEPLATTLRKFRDAHYNVTGLSSHADQSLKSYTGNQTIFVLGNETDGVSRAVQDACNNWVKIPMNNQVESLNVAVTAALIAFR
ncbi:TrmH family RNA methyltransferase [Gilvimarinus polysaccharolyticus]|uniref:TrmH family RNA methyltransferase n=1 Tax=Gilvimarinus polysaccharolyticus TaxID=863921 RepID=UPI000673819F|nr:RNA methyltransferase [Gilvimarinus polysaccharolyticus]